MTKAKSKLTPRPRAAKAKGKLKTPADALDAQDTLTANLRAATSIVHLAAVASLREHDVNVAHFFCALDTAYDHLQQVKQAADDLFEAHNAMGAAHG